MLEYGYLAPAMFAGLIVFLLIGFPVTFSLMALGLSFGLIAIEVGYFDLPFLQALPYRVFGIMANDLLLAIPFFTFMGVILERSGLAEDLLEGIGQAFGKIPGGLAYAVIVVGAILGAITGTVAASVIAMGMISLPIMMKYGYDMKIATGVIAASGTITQVIRKPCSYRSGRPVGCVGRGHVPWRHRPFAGSGACLHGLHPGHFDLFSRPRASLASRGPHAARCRAVLDCCSRCRSVARSDLPCAGNHFHGSCNPDRGRGHGRGWRDDPGRRQRAVQHSAALERNGPDHADHCDGRVHPCGATVFSLVFQGVNGGKWIEHLLTGIPGGVIGFLIFVNIFIFFLAFFLDFFEIVFIVVPLLVPVAVALDINLVWFGLLLCVNMQTAFMHPPFGFALFYLRGIARLRSSRAISTSVRSPGSACSLSLSPR